MAFWAMRRRFRNVETYKTFPIESQNRVMLTNLFTAKDTELGQLYRFDEINSYNEFCARIPLVTYEEFQPLIERARKGELDVIWPGNIQYFAKSSGTTNAQSKYIPVSNLALEKCHFKAGKDLFAVYCNNHPDDSIFSSLNIRLGGSSEIHEEAYTIYGDLSAIIIDNLPFWTDFLNTPNRKISLMSDWDEKLSTIVADVKDKDISTFTGVPSWMLMLLQNVKKETGVEYLDDLWPNVQTFFHGGVSFKPYKDIYNSLFRRQLRYYEIYNASEGFFAIQDEPDSEELLLLVDHGIFYEFIPMSDFDKSNPKTYSLKDVDTDTNYAIVISTNGGLWRYILGDTVRFTSTFPFRIKVTGRTKHFINAFGEELMIENAEEALQKTCRTHNCSIVDFTAAPVFMDTENAGAHEWIIEFEKAPNNLKNFTETLDQNLQNLNSDYQAKRFNNMTLRMPIIHESRTGLFHDWMKKNGKLGGQNKVPRLVNDRQFLEPLLEMNS